MASRPNPHNEVQSKQSFPQEVQPKLQTPGQVAHCVVSPQRGGSHKKPSSPSSSVFRRFLWRIRERWKILGFFEIDSNHAHYRLTCMIKAGLQDAIQVSIDCPCRCALKEEDYTSVLTQAHEGFEMNTMAGPVFAHLRSFLGLKERDYQNSLSSSHCFLQFITNSKSKANFFLTNDKRFFLKTQNECEIKFLLSKLTFYIRHLHQYPHSLLVKFLGIHSIKVAQEKKKYFIIMQSIFYPEGRISERYDIKGCQVSRWTEPLPEDSHIIVVLKDINFEGHTISLGSERSWFIKQMELDTTFLRNLNVLDYSLLVAFQRLHLDEKYSIKNTLSQVANSVHGVRGEASSVSYTASDRFSRHWNKYFTSKFMRNTKSYNVSAHNCRLLPSLPNALHTLDGPEYRYFIGIVDFFTVYNLRKRLEFLWKSILYPGRSFSTVNPTHYARRLCHWVDTHTI